MAPPGGPERGGARIVGGDPKTGSLPSAPPTLRRLHFPPDDGFSVRRSPRSTVARTSQHPRPQSRTLTGTWACRWRRARKARTTASGEQVAPGVEEGGAAEATFAFSGLPPWKGEAGPGWGLGTLPPLAPGSLQVQVTAGGSGGAPPSGSLETATGELRATGPVLQMGKLRPLQDHSPFWNLLQPLAAAPVETEAPEGMGRVDGLSSAGGPVWVGEAALPSQHLQPPLRV
ncbi:uncharacterized protein LOC125083831 isoform X2 [Lutra lutra]|uniref:uncharacterized protein LOC125083831 isoform X2 n=1 Tax=Lutra lutra TaxID=9657 RepID=UPI001FD24A82|nr:uncharacterized protein LOC125083831 isoform X2 [Lutra lutra]